MFKLVGKYTREYAWAAIVTPILVILEVLFDVLIPYIMSIIIDSGINGANGADLPLIYKMGFVMIGLSVCAMVCGSLAGRTSAIASVGFVKNIRCELFRKIQSYSFANIEKFEVPSLVTRVTKDMREIRMAYASIIRALVRAPLQLIISTIMVFMINRSLAAIFFVALPVLATGLYFVAKTARPRFRILMRKFDSMNASLEENFVAIRVVKTFVREAFEKEKFNTTSKDVVKSQRFAESIVILNDPFFNLVTYSCMIALSWFGGKYIITGALSQGEFMSYLSYMKQILFSLMMASMVLMQIIMAGASVDRINEVLDEKIDIDDTNCDEALKVADGSIDFNNVSFAYSSKADKMALRNVDLHIASGETVGIIGSTGSSKTTLVQLIPRLYDASEGEVLVGGVNVKDYKLKNLRQAVAMVLQKNVLFSGTIEENLKWGDGNASHEDVVEAAKCAQADDFISSFPEGYNTYLGQGGVNVSGGQQQRLCIARALLKKPKIIILDDSTSAVDTDTDKRIRTALRERLSGMTTIIIAQRIASVMDSDKIIVMDDGAISDIGTHDELMARNEIYRDLYTTQAKGVGE